MPIRNVFTDIPTELPEEMAQTLLDHKNVRIERIVSHGQASPDGFWYDQDEYEWVLLLQGAAGLMFEGEAAVRMLKPGDFILIPAHTRHRVAWIDPDTATIWLAIFFS
ncbi:MAG: cupin domain-containing protein [Mariprofundaceae bacterium]